MHALQLIAPRTFQRTEVPDPFDTLPEEHVAVRLRTAAVCGSDMPYFKGEVADPFPLEVGLSIHECIGEVSASRSGRFRPGQRVLALPFHQRGLFEYLALPAGRVFPIAEDSPPHHVLAQPLATVLWACRKLPSLLGKRVVVLGQGPIGLYFDQLIASGGARQVIGVDLVPERLAAGARMGATACIDGRSTDVVEAVRELTDGEMADVVVEAVGHQPATVNLAIDVAAQGGDVLLFGVPTEKPYPFPMRAFFKKNLNLLTSVDPDLGRYFPLAIDMVQRGVVDVAPLATHSFSVSEIAAAFRLVEARTEGVLKPIITFDW